MSQSVINVQLVQHNSGFLHKAHYISNLTTLKETEFGMLSNSLFDHSMVIFLKRILIAYNEMKILNMTQDIKCFYNKRRTLPS